LKQAPQNDLSHSNVRLKGGNNMQRLAPFGALPLTWDTGGNNDPARAIFE